MILLRFPFRWGPAVTVVVTPEATPEPALWQTVGASAQHWVGRGSFVMPRFEHIFPEADTGPQFIRDTDVVD